MFLCSLLKNISKEIKKGFIRREVSDVGTMDGMLPHSQLETQINRVWSWLYIFSGYSALPPNIKMSLWHYEQLQNLLSSPSGDFFQCWAGTWYFPTEKYRRRKYNITSFTSHDKRKSPLQTTHRRAPLVWLISGHQQVMDLLIVHFKVAHLYMTIYLKYNQKGSSDELNKQKKKKVVNVFKFKRDFTSLFSMEDNLEKSSSQNRGITPSSSPKPIILNNNELNWLIIIYFTREEKMKRAEERVSVKHGRL